MSEPASPSRALINAGGCGPGVRRSIWRLAALLAVLLFAGAGRAGAQPPCPGDCNGDGQVTVSELILGVNVALGISGVAACRVTDTDGDDRISVGELIAAVGSALNGCGGGPAACPIDFADLAQDMEQPLFCAFRGGWNTACGHRRLEATFFSVRQDGETFVAAVVFTDPVVVFVGSFGTATRTTLGSVGLAADPSIHQDVGGNLRLADGGRTLIIEPDPVPFDVDDCPFERYAGSFTGIRDAPPPGQ